MNDENPLGNLFLESASRYGERTAIKTPNSQVSYLELKKLSVNFALHLVNNGVGRGSQLAMGIRNAPILTSASILAATFLGARWIDFKPALRKQGSIRITHLIHNNSTVPEEPGILLVDETWLKTPENFGSREKVQFAGFESADDIWFTAVSSGSTGTPKYMPVSGRMFYQRVKRLTDDLASEVPPLTSCWFNRYSNLGCLHFFQTICHGGTDVASTSYRYLADQGVDFVAGSPAHLSKVLTNLPAPQEPEIFEIRVVGGALHPQLLARLLKYFRQVRVSYGSTEAGPTTSKLITDDTPDRSVGRCYADVALEIVDEEDNLLKPGEEGNLRIKTTSQIEAYVDNTNIPGEALRDGWFYPGDKAHISPDGDVCIVGRVKDQLNIAGLKINAVELDEIIQGFEKVADGLCFVELDEHGHEILAALVTLEAGVDLESVVEKLFELVSLPGGRKTTVTNFYGVEEIPRNENGKVMRHKASELVKGLKPITQSHNK